MTTQQIAQIAHETNAAYCRSIGDTSQPAWADAPDWQKQSAVNGVVFHFSQLDLGRDPEPSASHDSWLREKAAAGWTYGPVKDAEKKQHPCFVPYVDLPVEQRLKDYLFAAVVGACYRALQEVS